MSAIGLKEFASQQLLCDLCEGIPQNPGKIVTESRSHEELTYCMECLFIRIVEESEGMFCPCCKERIIRVEIDFAKRAQIDALIAQTAEQNYASAQLNRELTIDELKGLEILFGVHAAAMADRVGVPNSITYPIIYEELETSFAKYNTFLPFVFKQFERDCKRSWALFPAVKILLEGLFLKDQEGSYETDWGIFTTMFCKFIQKVANESGKSDSLLCQFFSQLEREMSEKDVGLSAYKRV